MMLSIWRENFCNLHVHVTNLRLFDKKPAKWGVMTRQGMIWENPFFWFKPCDPFLVILPFRLANHKSGNSSSCLPVMPLELAI